MAKFACKKKKGSSVIFLPKTEMSPGCFPEIWSPYARSLHNHEIKITARTATSHFLPVVVTVTCDLPLGYV